MPVPTITYAQSVWLGALEWCESRGVPHAVNKVDRDGTPSFYSFQFKPSTFEYYALKYDVVSRETLEADFETYLASSTQQRKVVEQMLLHYDEITWTTQFPDCIKNKIGMPPRY